MILPRYCNKQGERSTHHLDTVHAKYPDIAKRLKYTKDILHEVLHLDHNPQQHNNNNCHNNVDVAGAVEAK